MTPNKKILNPRERLAKERLKNYKSPNADYRAQTVSISSLYLFLPLLFVPQIINAPVASPAPYNPPSFIDMLDGQGGPEKVQPLIREPLDVIKVHFEEEDHRFDIFKEENLSATPTITKILNHLKVADTVMPTASPKITSDYGWRTPPCRGCSADHKGVDFVPGYGEPIFAVADGMVTEMGRNGGYGNYVKLQHLVANSEGVMEEWETLYAHMKNDSFPEGMKIGSAIKSGETIGAVGNTGMSTGPHLHFELLINGEHVDPLPLLGTYEVIIVTEEEYEDYMFVGETIKRIETIVTYE